MAENLVGVEGRSEPLKNNETRLLFVIASRFTQHGVHHAAQEEVRAGARC